MLSFYEILGFEFTAFKVLIGGQGYRAVNGGLELCLYSIDRAERAGQVPSFQLGVCVADVEQVVAQLKEKLQTDCILDPTQFPDGKRAIVLDPDGHSIELTQKAV